MAVLDWLQQLLGQEQDQGAPMAVQNRQGGFDPYTPQKPPDALELLYEMSGGKDLGQAYNAYQRGEYLPAFGQGAYGAAQAASMALPALRAGGAAARAGAPLAREAAGAIPGMLADETGAIRAWHASPYDFNKFDLSKVGTGQGAQSYGHGIYAAESPAVSGKGGQYDLEFTAKNLGKYDLNPGELLIHRMLRADRSDMDILGELARGGGYTFDEAAAALDRVKAAKAKIYEVDIHADPKSFLDWDRPLLEQPPQVQGALKSLSDVYPLRDISLDLLPGQTAVGRHAYSKLAKATSPDYDIGQVAASGELKESGILGIRYLDEGSRPGSRNVPDISAIQSAIKYNQDIVDASKTFNPRLASEHQRYIDGLTEQLERAKNYIPTHNYAIFDPSIIDIRRKYGILPPLAAGGLLGAAEE